MCVVCVGLVGEWKEDLRHGWGKCVYPNGDIFEGYFENGIKISWVRI